MSQHMKICDRALRHQLAVYQQTIYRPQLRPSDRLFWAWLSHLWSGWQVALEPIPIGQIVYT